MNIRISKLKKVVKTWNEHLRMIVRSCSFQVLIYSSFGVFIARWTHWGRRKMATSYVGYWHVQYCPNLALNECHAEIWYNTDLLLASFIWARWLAPIDCIRSLSQKYTPLHVLYNAVRLDRYWVIYIYIYIYKFTWDGYMFVNFIIVCRTRTNTKL